MNKYLKRFIAARNTRASAALEEMACVIPRCRIINSVGRFYASVERAAVLRV